MDRTLLNRVLATHESGATGSIPVLPSFYEFTLDKLRFDGIIEEQEMEMILQAAHMAAVIHDTQKRSDGSPYIYHPMRVAGRTMLADGSEQMVCAAWLHDTLEDQPDRTDLDMIRHRFGVGTVILIRELTNVFTKESFPDMNRAERKAHECNRLSTISPEGQLIKVLDRIDNLMDKPKSDGRWQKLYLSESEGLLEALTVAPSYLRNELKWLIQHMKESHASAKAN